MPEGRYNHPTLPDLAPMLGDEQLHDGYSFWDGLIGESVANAASLPSASARPAGHLVTTLDTTTLYVTTGAAWVQVGPVRHRMAAGEVLAGASTGNNAIVFPASRFSVEPLVLVTPLNPAAGAVDFFFTVTARTVSGCTIQVSNGTGFISGVGFTWLALQMTSTDAAG